MRTTSEHAQRRVQRRLVSGTPWLSVPVASVAVLALAGCGAASSQQAASTSIDDSLVTISAEVTASPVEATPPRLAAGEDLWSSYGPALASAEEAEQVGSVEEMAASADAVVLGTITTVEAGRLYGDPQAPSASVQYLVYHIQVDRATGVVAEQFVLPIEVTSAELEAAVKATMHPVDSNKNGVFDDSELAAGYDQDAVVAVYAKYWDAALAETLADAQQRVPKVQSLFFLRYEPAYGVFRLMTGDAIIVNDGGTARVPMRELEDEARTAVRDQVANLDFGSVVTLAFEHATTQG